MFRGILSICLGFIAVVGLLSCGGGKKEKVAKKVNWKGVEVLGTSLKVPTAFKKIPGGGSESVQYMYSAGIALINIEKGKLDENGLEGLYKKEYEKRRRDTNRRMKRNNAYEIIEKKDITIGGKKAFEVEQEFQTGTGDTRAHNIEINIDKGGGKLLTVKWEVTDLDGISWEKAYSRYFKESRASFRVK